MNILDKLLSWLRDLLGKRTTESPRAEAEPQELEFRIEGQNVVAVRMDGLLGNAKNETSAPILPQQTGAGEAPCKAPCEGPFHPTAPMPSDAIPTRDEQHAAQIQSLMATLKLQAQQLPPEQAIQPSAPPATKSRLKLKPQETHSPTAPQSAQEKLREETRQSLANLTQAPAMGWLANNLLVLMRRNDVDLGEVVEAISKDPAIFTRILRMANSPVVAPYQRVSDLKTAVSLLGIQRVRLTAQALVTMQETSNLVEGFNWRHLWIHSFACALLAAEIPKELHMEVPPNCYLSGLLHDMGKIVLSYLNPPKYRQLLMDAVCDGTALHELELKHFGMTHEEAGAEFARLSKLPVDVISAIEDHATPEHALESQLLVAYISVANYLAKTHGLGFSGSSLASMEENLGDTQGWKIIAAAVPRAPSAEDFHLQLRPFIADLKQELHGWAAGKKERKKRSEESAG